MKNFENFTYYVFMAAGVNKFLENLSWKYANFFVYVVLSRSCRDTHQ